MKRLIVLLAVSACCFAQGTISSGTISSGKFGDATPKTGTIVQSSNFEDGTFGSMTVGAATCSIDSATGANGTSKSAKCTCAFTSAPSSACSGGGGQAEITYTYSGTDPAYGGEIWESYWIKTDSTTITAANTSTGQIKTHLRRKSNANSIPDLGWSMHGFGNTFVGGGTLRLITKDYGLPGDSAANGVDLSDGLWHRVVERMRVMGGQGCTTVWMDDMVTPKKNYCAIDIGNQTGGTNYTTRFGICYGNYGGASNGNFTVWVDEIVSATYDIR
jgi:hypothetical protein